MTPFPDRTFDVAWNLEHPEPDQFSAELESELSDSEFEFELESELESELELSPSHLDLTSLISRRIGLNEIGVFFLTAVADGENTFNRCLAYTEHSQR